MIFLWLVASSLTTVLTVAWLALEGGEVCLVLQQCWLFCVAQSAMWDGSLQGESPLVFAWGSVPGGTRSIAGMIMATVLHHHCGFLVHLKAEANLGLAAHVKAESSALENLVSPA